MSKNSKDWYQRNRDKICRERRARYAADEGYREKCKKHSREFYDCPERAARGRLLRARDYQKHAAKRRQRSIDYYYSNWEKSLLKNAERRKRNREYNRASARWHTLNLTDRYIREQLSKYSDISMWEWTPAQVDAKREKIIQSRTKRITDEKASLIRGRYANGESARCISDAFGVSPGLIHLVVKNRMHVNDSYVPPARNSRIYFRLAHDAKLIQDFFYDPKQQHPST